MHLPARARWHTASPPEGLRDTRGQQVLPIPPDQADETHGGIRHGPARIATGYAPIMVHPTESAFDRPTPPGQTTSSLDVAHGEPTGVRGLGRHCHRGSRTALVVRDMSCRMGLIPYVAVMPGDGFRRGVIEEIEEWSQCAGDICMTWVPARDPGSRQSPLGLAAVPCHSAAVSALCHIRICVGLRPSAPRARRDHYGNCNGC
jgi:hypothetical protein